MPALILAGQGIGSVFVGMIAFLIAVIVLKKFF